MESWNVKGAGRQDSTPIKNEDLNNPVDDKAFSKPNLFGDYDDFSVWNNWEVTDSVVIMPLDITKML